MTLRDLVDLYAGLLIVAVLFDLGCYLAALVLFRGQIRQWWLNRRYRRQIEREFRQAVKGNRGHLLILPDVPVRERAVPRPPESEPWPPR